MKTTNLLFLSGILSLLATICHAQSPREGFGQIRTNLYILAPDKSPTLMDGTLTQYDSSYSNEMDGLDARKMSNFSENWGMLRGNTVYVIERRQTISEKDTIFFKMWNMRIITYQMEFIASKLDFNGRTAFLIDKYLNTTTPVQLNDTTRIPFEVTNVADSKATDRFTLVFSFPDVPKTPPLVVVKTELYSNKKNNNLVWNTDGYSVNSIFDIERASDGIDFKSVGKLASDSGVNHYNFTDYKVKDGKKSYYRIKVSSKNDSTNYGSVVSIDNDKEEDGIIVFPNPVKGNNIKIKFADEAAGRYTATLSNSFGLSIVSQSFNYEGGKQTEELRIDKSMQKGVYRLQITGPDGYQKIISVLF